jgi:hypothetical protein
MVNEWVNPAVHLVISRHNEWLGLQVITDLLEECLALFLRDVESIDKLDSADEI